jgi:hypothetical protein
MNRWCEGFGRYGGTKSFMLNGSSGQAWAQVDSGFSLSSANPRTGAQHMRMTGNASFNEARRVFGSTLTEVFLGKALYCHALPATETTNGLTSGISAADGVYLFDLRDQSNGSQLSVWIGTDGALEVRSRGTVLGRTIPIIGAGAYQHVELYAKASNTVGAVEIRVDEVTRLNLTGIDTIFTANVEFSQDACGQNQTAVNPPMIDFADFFCNDTTSDGSGCDTFVGDVKSGVLMVNADTAQADFAKSTGTVGYSLLNEKPPVDAGFISIASATGESDFGLENGPGNLSEILTIRPFVRALKDDAGTCTIAPNMISNSIKATVSAQPITTAAAYYDSNVPLNPDTAAPWTLTELNAALEVVERIS